MVYQYPFKGTYALGTLYGVKGSAWSCGWHSGLDLLSTSKGGDGKVYPIAAGTVIKTTAADKSYGISVRVRHANGYISLYAHLSKLLVSVGQTVTLSTQLGKEGSTGNSTGIHLHIEIHANEYKYPAAINPKTFLDGAIARQGNEGDEMATITATTLILNGKEKQFDSIAQNGVTYTALRPVLQELGYTVSYDALTKKITIYKA